MSDSDSSPVLGQRKSRTLLSRRFSSASSSLVLASGSATRAALLAAAGVPVDIHAADLDEAAIKQDARERGLAPGRTALLLATAKAHHVAALHPDALVIGADQLLVSGTRWFDKPADLDQARQQLLALRNRAHVLHTAVCMVRNDTVIWSEVAQPSLSMRDFSDAFLEAYLACEGHSLLSSVGAYRLEGPGIQLFDRIVGEHAAILGLPMLGLLACLRQQGMLLE